MSRDDDPTRRLADFAASLTYDDLPPDVAATVKRLILDTLGAALAATTLGAGCREAVTVMESLGGRPESTILGHGTRVAAPHAAFANGALAHALNYDPIGHEAGHVGVVCLAAPLAMAEAVGGVSGRAFLAASAVACEITARLTAAGKRGGRQPRKNVLAGQLFGYFGAAAGAGHILGLGAAGMRDAFGLALMQAAGSMQVVLAGDPPAKAIYGAFPNQAGVLAALLSQAGLGAACDAVAGPAGLYVMTNDGDHDADALTDGLGTEFRLTGTGIKPWPTSLFAHPFIEAAIQIAQDVHAPEIESVELVGHSHIRAWCEPLDQRRRPENTAAAGNSIPFSVAKSLVHGDVTLADLTTDGLADEAALAVGARTSYRLDDRIQGGIVRVATRDGRRLEAHIQTPLGDGTRPTPRDRLVAKFRDCCGYATAPLAPEAVDRLIEQIETLERVDDIGCLASMAGGR